MTFIQLEHELDLDKASYFYSSQKGTEKQNYFDRMLWDNVLTRELLEKPEKWLSVVSKINSDARVGKILSLTEHLYPGTLKQYGIEPPMETDADYGPIREKLKNITYGGLSKDEIEKWKTENTTIGWPKETEERFDKLFKDKSPNEQSLLANLRVFLPKFH